MPGGGDVSMGVPVAYMYDGSFEGFLCCVYDSVYRREMPLSVTREEDAPMLLDQARFVVTDQARAARVKASIPEKISGRALELTVTVFCSCLDNKELMLLRFLLRGYKEGGNLCYKLGDELVAVLLAAERHLLHETHLLKGFTRFMQAEDALVAQITPKNYILPFIAQHFSLRLKTENFVIMDKTHHTALVHREGRTELLRVERFDLPQPGPREKHWQELWKRFYNTIAIEGRENPRCRMSHMPKRYWENMPEVKDLLRGKNAPSCVHRV